MLDKLARLSDKLHRFWQLIPCYSAITGQWHTWPSQMSVWCMEGSATNQPESLLAQICVPGGVVNNELEKFRTIFGKWMDNQKVKVLRRWSVSTYQAKMCISSILMISNDSYLRGAMVMTKVEFWRNLFTNESADCMMLNLLEWRTFGSNTLPLPHLYQ